MQFLYLLGQHNNETSVIDVLITLKVKNLSLTYLSDFELLHLFRAGDNSAYVEIYQRYHKKLYFHALKMLNDREEAQDVIQELFIKLLDKRESICLNTSLSSYLYTSVRNRILDIFSHVKVVEKHQQSLQDFMNRGEYITDNYVREKELSKIIEAEIAELPTKMREVFELSRTKEMTYAEIAAELDMAENTVRKHISKALKKLRPKLSDYLYLTIIPSVELIKFFFN